VLPRIARERVLERVPTIGLTPPNQIVKPRALSPKRCRYDRAAAPIQAAPDLLMVSIIGRLAAIFSSCHKNREKGTGQISGSCRRDAPFPTFDLSLLALLLALLAVPRICLCGLGSEQGA
jgi:hypothetical protein